jgi:hypothetical protein
MPCFLAGEASFLGCSFSPICRQHACLEKRQPSNVVAADPKFIQVKSTDLTLDARALQMTRVGSQDLQGLRYDCIQIGSLGGQKHEMPSCGVDLGGGDMGNPAQARQHGRESGASTEALQRASAVISGMEDEYVPVLDFCCRVHCASPARLSAAVRRRCHKERLRRSGACALSVNPRADLRPVSGAPIMLKSESATWQPVK